MSRQADLPAAPLPPAPRFAMGRAALFYALAVLILGLPALLGQFLVSPTSDQVLTGFAFRELGAEMLRAGHGFPLWNPYLMGGVPFVAGMGGDIFYPTFLLRMVLPTDVAMTWGFIIHVFLAGLFTFGFLRAWGTGFQGSLVGGAAYMLSGPVASLVSPGHDGKLFVAAMLPLSLWMVVRGVRDGRPWAWGVLALAVGLGVLSPHPQLLQYMLLAAGGFGLYVAFARYDGVPLDRKVAIGRLGLAAAAVIVGFLVGAIQYLPVFEYVDWSPRSGGRDITYSASFAKPPEELLGTVIADFTGALETYWGRNSIKLHSEYFGAAVLFLAGAAFGAAQRWRGFVWFWTGALVVALLWSLGLATPFFRIVYALVPGTQFFRAPDNMFMVVAMAVATLAAAGTDRILVRPPGRGYLIGWGIAGGIILLIGLPGVYTSLAEGLLAHPQWYEQMLQNRMIVFARAVQAVLFLGATMGAMAAFATGRLSATALGWLLAALITIDLALVERRFWRFSPPASVLYAPDATIEYLAAQDQPGRVLAFPGSRAAARDPNLGGSGLMVHNIRQVQGYHGNELQRFRDIAGYEEGWRNATHPNFLQLYNVRWVLTDVPDLGLEGSRLAAGPARSAAGTTVYLHELPGERPFAWVAPVIVQASDPVVLQTLLDPRYDDVRRAALFDTSAAVQARELTSLPAPLEIDARVTGYEPGRIDIELSEPAPPGSVLVASENYYPGWRARVNGREVPAERVNYTLIGVPLEEGDRQIELRFESATYERGRMITLLALAVIALGIAGGIFAERRRRV